MTVSPTGRTNIMGCDEQQGERAWISDTNIRWQVAVGQTAYILQTPPSPPALKHLLPCEGRGG